MSLADIEKHFHCLTRYTVFGPDPAGIVFYAAFFRMFNDLFEDWLVKCPGIDFADQFENNNECFRSFMLMWISRIPANGAENGFKPGA